MAIYSFRVSIVKRANGSNAVASAAYRAAESLANETTGQTHDYSRKGGVLHAEILTPENAPDWTLDREKLWNKVEAKETRANAQTARELTMALPHEINDEQRLDLVRGFLNEECVSKGMVADFVLHLPDGEGDERNHHAHAMLTMREIDPDGFTRKAREWNSRTQLEHWRIAWQDHVNKALERAGRPERVDHRTLEDQGLKQEPTLHEGPEVTAMTREGEQADAAIANENRQKRNAQREQLKNQYLEISLIIDRPELAKALASQTKPDLKSALKSLRMVDQQNTALNNLRRKITTLRKQIFAHDKRQENLKQLDLAVKGGLASVYRNPEKAQIAYINRAHHKASNPNNAARLMKQHPTYYGRLKGYAIGNLWHSRTRKEALTTIPILAEKAAKAEYIRNKQAQSTLNITKARQRHQALTQQKETIENHPTAERLIALRQIQKAATGMNNKTWKSLPWPTKKAITEARQTMRSDTVRKFADKAMAALRQRQREQERQVEIERERERNKDRGFER